MSVAHLSKPTVAAREAKESYHCQSQSLSVFALGPVDSFRSLALTQHALLHRFCRARRRRRGRSLLRGEISRRWVAPSKKRQFCFLFTFSICSGATTPPSPFSTCLAGVFSHASLKIWPSSSISSRVRSIARRLTFLFLSPPPPPLGGRPGDVVFSSVAQQHVRQKTRWK